MTISDINFLNHFTEHLPADSEHQNFPRQVENAAYSLVNPSKVAQPRLIAYEPDVAELLNIKQETINSEEFTALVSGNLVLPPMQPYAMCYGGHQFGQWAGQLGDGRAINLGEITNKNQQLTTMQLKGSGLTPYSRTADGLAVLRSSVREFLCSEAMYHLGIPTTRALSLCLTSEHVLRDMFYDGNAAYEPGAVVCRVSNSFMRFGSFQLPSQRNDMALLKQLVDYNIVHHYSHLGKPSKEVYLAWFNEICQRTCELVVHWMRVGFVHGVLNTDNMSIIGETIDYGPYGWIDNFDLHWTPNTTDAHGKRYRFGAQSVVSQWNLYQLANAIYPLIEEAEPLQIIIDNYPKMYQNKWLTMMLSKLGLAPNKHSSNKDDEALINDLEDLLSQVATDMTIFYRLLAKIPIDEKSPIESIWLDTIKDCYYSPNELSDEYINAMSAWMKRYQIRATKNKSSSEDRQNKMNAVNPKYVLRNYLAQQAIELTHNNDFTMLHQLQQVLRTPYNEQPEFDHFASKRPDWAKEKAGCSMLSCSS